MRRLGLSGRELRRADGEQRKTMIPKQFGSRHAALGRWIVILTLLGSAAEWR